MAENGHTHLVAIRLPAPDAAVAITAAWNNGDAVVVIDPALPDAAAETHMARARPTVLVDAAGRRDLPSGDPVAASVAAVVLTSGTTSVPQAVSLSRDGKRAMAAAYSAAIGAQDDDRWLACVPLSGVAGLAIVARSHETHIPMTAHREFNPARVAAAPATDGATIVSLVPRMLRRLLEIDAPLEQFSTILVGGAPLPSPLRRQAEESGARIVATYGMTETWGGCVLNGLPIPGCTVRIGTDNEIEVRGPMIMTGYHGDQAATAVALGPDGWLRTGDSGHWDDDRLVVTGRIRDVIVTGGVNVSPATVEGALRDHPAIADVAVAGRPDEEWGEAIVAFVVPRDRTAPPTLDELRLAIKTKLGAASAPRRLVLVDTIPRNPGGKVIRDELR